MTINTAPANGAEEDQSADRLVRVEIGGVRSAAARVWIPNTMLIVDAVAANPDKVPFELPPEVEGTFRAYLSDWLEAARAADDFSWEGMAPRSEVQTLLLYWVNIDRLSDRTMESLGVSWSPPEGRPFFEALTHSIIGALVATGDMDELVQELERIWA